MAPVERRQRHEVQDADEHVEHDDDPDEEVPRSGPSRLPGELGRSDDARRVARRSGPGPNEQLADPLQPRRSEDVPELQHDRLHRRPGLYDRSPRGRHGTDPLPSFAEANPEQADVPAVEGRRLGRGPDRDEPPIPSHGDR